MPCLMYAVFAVAVAAAAADPQPQHPASHGAVTPATADAQDCAQAQLVVDGLLAQMAARLETARLSNSPSDMRAAIDRLQDTVRDLRAQLAPCAALTPADPHDGHLGHGAPSTATPAGPKKPPV
jgi:hypothetical protein